MNFLFFLFFVFFLLCSLFYSIRYLFIAVIFPNEVGGRLFLVVIWKSGTFKGWNRSLCVLNSTINLHARFDKPQVFLTTPLVDWPLRIYTFGNLESVAVMEKAVTENTMLRDNSRSIHNGLVSALKYCRQNMAIAYENGENFFKVYEIVPLCQSFRKILSNVCCLKITISSE